MRHSMLKTIPALAPGFALRDKAPRLYHVWSSICELARLGPPLRLLALICLFLVAAASLSAVVAQDPPLSAPTGLSASSGAGGVTLSWTAPAGKVDGYEILRQLPLQGETALTTLVANTGNANTSYTDASAKVLGERYVYRIRAIRDGNPGPLSFIVSVDIVTVSCQIVAGNNHDILQCSVDAGDQVVTSALWTPSFETRYDQRTTRPAASWVIADEYCGESTTVKVVPSAGDTVLTAAETTITLACAPPPTDDLTVSCENLVVNDQQKLRCRLSGGDQDITSSQWTPFFSSRASQSKTGAEALGATWDISAALCGQTTSIRVEPSTEDAALDPIFTGVSIPCLIIVDANCSLANAIRSANGNAQIEDTNDSDGNDDCEAGAATDDSIDPPNTGDDIILLKQDVTLAAELPVITSRIHIEGSNRTISGDAKYRVMEVVAGHLTVSDLTLTKGLGSTVGGGIFVNGGSLTIKGSAITTSKANDIGGAIYAIDSNVDISDTEFTGNATVKSHGGAVYFVSSTGLHTLDILGSTFKNNRATEDGGALKTAGGIATIDRSSFTNNQADEGGAIESSETTFTITNSTFSGNSAREGGGLSSFSSFVTLTHTTWANNSATEQGGGIAIIGWTGNFKIRNTLITNSKNGGDCHSGPNPNIIIEFTGNFIQDGSCEPAEAQAAAPDSAEDQAEAQQVIEAVAQADNLEDAKIGDLTGNPPHHPLNEGSPAIDSADPIYCLLDDQPLTARPQNGNCDIGAFEYPRAPDSTPAPPSDPPRVTPTPDDPTPRSVPTPGPTRMPGDYICVDNYPIVVNSPGQDVNCAEIDILTLDKHPALQGMRFAVRLWQTDNECLHTVSLGDNLYRLAIQYETSVDVLRRHNDLTSSELSVGQQLALPFCAQETGTIEPATEVCFEALGSIVLIDTSTPERTVHSIATYTNGDLTCGLINRPGIVALVAADSA